MKASNLADVGQMRRSKGISMKMMRNEQTLSKRQRAILKGLNKEVQYLQADDTEDDYQVKMKDIGDA
jgi:hypothetical protein